jgi:Protein of unknown function (DUF1656)
MIAEFDIYGVFVPALLIFAIVAFAILLGLRYVLDLVGFYRFVWHRPLFDFALFVILFGAVAALAEPVIGLFRQLTPGLVV